MVAARVRSLIALSASVLAAGLARAAPPQDVAYITNQGGGIAVLDLATWHRTQMIQVGKDPRGIAITPDGRRLVTANQADADVSIVDTATGQTVKRIGVGKNAEFVRISPDGLRAYVTYEPSSTGKPPAKEDAGAKKAEPAGAGRDDDAARAEIAVIDLASMEVTARLPASLETEGMEFSPDGKRLVVANEGDDTVVVYDLASGTAVRTIDVTPYGKRPRGVKVSPDGSTYLVTLENSDNVLVLDADLKAIRAIPTGKGPYGIAYEPGGARVWIAAARSEQMQVLDARTLAPVASIAVGKRCWHLSFTPDGRDVLAACGRSNSVSVIDTSTLKTVQTLDGFQQPWGIVTWPKSDGSLDRAASTIAAQPGAAKP
jgi:YVTN family beta-propeller protein